jgi:hypothetical protein
MSEVDRSGEGSSGGNLIPQSSLDKASEFASVYRSDFVPRELCLREAEILFQRHGKYDNKLKNESGQDNPNAGSLTPEAVEEESREAEAFLRKQIESIPPEERKTLSLMFIASDTAFGGRGQRSMETGNIALEAARKILREYGLEDSQILNNSDRIKGDEGVRPYPLIREPKAFEESPDYISYLKETFDPDGKGLGQKFWIAFEEDLASDVREEMGAEGPDGLADRLKKALAVFKRFSANYLRNNPDRRLIIWAATHYDTISAFTKRDIYHADKSEYVDVVNGAGIVIKVDEEGSADTIIDGKKYEITV